VDGEGVGVPDSISVGPGLGLRFLARSLIEAGDGGATVGVVAGGAVAAGGDAGAGVVAGGGGVIRGGMVRLGISRGRARAVSLVSPGVNEGVGNTVRTGGAVRLGGVRVGNGIGVDSVVLAGVGVGAGVLAGRGGPLR